MGRDVGVRAGSSGNGGMFGCRGMRQLALELGSVSHLPGMPGPEILHLIHALLAVLSVFEVQLALPRAAGKRLYACPLLAIMQIMHRVLWQVPSLQHGRSHFCDVPL